MGPIIIGSDMKHFIIGAALSGLTMGWGGCATKDAPEQLASAMSERYLAPADYAAHRAQQKLFEAEGGKIAFTDHGQGKVVVLLHGVPTSSWMYRKVVPGLQANMRVITVDQLGYGSSEKPSRDEADYSPAAQARRIQALLASRGVTEYSVLMHDMGGLTAWEMLGAQPEAIDKLIVLNTIVGQTGFKHPNMEAGFITSQLMKAYTSSLTSAAILDKTFTDLGLTGEYKLTEEECYGYVRPMREGSDDALFSFFTGVNDDLFKALETKRRTWPDYDVDMLVMWGGKDKILTTGQIPTLKTAFNIPDENIHIYDNNAHFLAEEIPDEIVAKVSGFIAR